VSRGRGLFFVFRYGEDEAGVGLAEDTEMGDGNTRGVKPVERGGAGKPKTKIKKNKSKGGGKISSHSSDGGSETKNPPDERAYKFWGASG
jgi:hypothetical protein